MRWNIIITSSAYWEKCYAIALSVVAGLAPARNERATARVTPTAGEIVK